jgi:hypothetical protein
LVERTEAEQRDRSRAFSERPPNEKPFFLIPVGSPAADPFVPDGIRKPLEEISVGK